MLTRDDAPPPMTLSTAIRLGAMLKPQAFGGEEGSASCALRAAAEAVGIKSYCGSGILNYFELRMRWPFLSKSVDPRPSGVPAYCDDYMSVIYNLNDEQRWTREQIADFVEGVEAAQSTDEPPSTNAVREETEQPFVPLRV